MLSVDDLFTSSYQKSTELLMSYNGFHSKDKPHTPCCHGRKRIPHDHDTCHVNALRGFSIFCLHRKGSWTWDSMMRGMAVGGACGTAFYEGSVYGSRSLDSFARPVRLFSFFFIKNNIAILKSSSGCDSIRMRVQQTASSPKRSPGRST